MSSDFSAMPLPACGSTDLATFDPLSTGPSVPAPSASFAAVCEGRDNHFNLLRMLAATGVMVSHAWPLALGPGTPEPLETLLQGDNLGRLCVFVFFGISGFFITRSFVERISLRDFALARVLRLYPGLVVMTVVVVGLLAALAAQDATAVLASLPQALGQVLTLGGLPALPGVFETNPVRAAVNGSLWTIVFEVWCYVGVAVLGMAGVLRRPWAVGLAVVLLIAGSVILRRYPVDFRLVMLTYLGLPFAWGAIIYLARRRLPRRGLGMAALLAAGLTACVLFYRTDLFLVPFTAVVVYAAMAAGYARLPVFDGYRRMGDYSYGMYIYAFPVQQVMAAWGARTPVGNLAAALPVTLLLAMLSWHLVEQPALRLRGPLASRIGGPVIGKPVRA